MSIALAGVGAAQRTGGGAPTFNKDVAPIVFKKCASCHRPKQAAPMSLLTYEDVRPWAQAIKRRVTARGMPPWYADPRFGSFRNDPTLSVEEIGTIVSWVDGGAREGAAPSPAAPQFAEGWNHPSGRPPDVVLQMPIEFAVPPQGRLEPFAVYSELPSLLAGGDHFVEAIQLMPGAFSAVHHSAFSMRALPVGVRLGSGQAWPGGPVLSNLAVLVDRSPAGLAARRQSSAAEAFSRVGTSHLVFYFPGNNGFVQFPTAVGKRIRHEDFVEWSVHYTPSGRAETDRERAGIWLQRAPPTHEVLTLRIGDFHIVNGQEIVLPPEIDTSPGHAAIVSVASRCAGAWCAEDRSMIPPIPPQAQNWKITAISPFQDDVTLYLAYPHGHLRLTDMTYVVTYPDGREATILSVPRYDFNWQLVYKWTQPLRIPAGSTIKAIGHYDNSSGNKRNPSPNTEVAWSEQSWDEMFNGYIDLSIDRMDVRTEGRTVGGGSTPKIPIVTVTGCLTRRADGAEMLTQASAAKPSPIVHADAREIADARTTPLGTARYHLVGTAEFGSAEELLTRGQRALYTRSATANTTGSLVTGNKIAVKGLMIPGSPDATLNLLSAQSLGEQCQP